MLNKVILMGRLVDTPELKTTPAGVSVASVRIAVDRDYVDKDGNRPCDFISVVFWRQTAEFVCRYFARGSMIAVVGSVQTRSYKTKEGQNRIATEIVAETASFTGERRDNTRPTSPSANASYENQPPQTAPTAQVAQTQQPQDTQPSFFNDDDLPF